MPLSTWTVYDAAGSVVGEYRLERAPRTSGTEMSVSPSGVGWQAALEDDKSVRMIPVDIELAGWGAASVQRQENLIAAAKRVEDTPSPTADETTGEPALLATIQGPWTAGANPAAEALYDAGTGVSIAAVYYGWKRVGTNINNADTNWGWSIAAGDDDVFSAYDQTANLRAAGPGFGALAVTTQTRRFATAQLGYSTGLGNDATFPLAWTSLAVYGNHGLQLYGIQTATEAPGVLASDVVASAVRRSAPILNLSTGLYGSVKPSAYVIHHLSFRDHTTVGEIVRQASKFELPFWGVWENKEFFWDASRAPRKRWRTRVAPAQLAETGPQVDRMWESVLVTYQDVDGSTRTVGPPGSGADTETIALKDQDTENPANQLGIIRRDMLVMGTGTLAEATQVGRIFLEQANLLDSSGQATLVGYVTDDHGVLYPYSHIRAGDEIAFVDAADPSYRRVVRTEKDHSARSCSLDLDSPPEGLQALLERLSVSLVRLGLS